MIARRAIAGFDSASGMVRVLGAALHGREAALLAQLPRWLKPGIDWLAARVEQLPEPAPQALYRRSGWLDAVPASKVADIRSDELAAWVVRKYPARKYPAVLIGSSNGALVHLAAALGIPWLPLPWENGTSSSSGRREGFPRASFMMGARGWRNFRAGRVHRG